MKRLLRLLVLYVFLFLFTSSCSVVQNYVIKKEDTPQILLRGYKKNTNKDYIDHLIAFEKAYVQTNKDKFISLDRRSKNYLTKKLQDLTRSNELFFKNHRPAKFYVVKSKVPFHFSLPEKKFFFSSSLFSKYIKNETMLYALLIYELIRSEKNIYKKRLIIPTGNMSTKKILSLLRLDVSQKTEIHKWAFYLLKRAGLDSAGYLSWLQVKNRNSVDFSVQTGDVRTSSQEEVLFKAFLIDKEKDGFLRKKHFGSSKEFYYFLNRIESKT